jgi:hypothetical protein
MSIEIVRAGSVDETKWTQLNLVTPSVIIGSNDKLSNFDIVKLPNASLTNLVYQPDTVYKKLVDIGLNAVSYIHLQHFLQKNELLTDTLKSKLSVQKTTNDLLGVLSSSAEFRSSSLCFKKI